MVYMGHETVDATEVLFDFSLLQPDDQKLVEQRAERVGSVAHGVHSLICEAIVACDMDIVEGAAANIVLCGGCTLLPGFVARLSKEVKKMSPFDDTVRILAPLVPSIRSIWLPET